MGGLKFHKGGILRTPNYLRPPRSATRRKRRASRGGATGTLIADRTGSDSAVAPAVVLIDWLFDIQGALTISGFCHLGQSKATT